MRLFGVAPPEVALEVVRPGAVERAANACGRPRPGGYAIAEVSDLFDEAGLPADPGIEERLRRRVQFVAHRVERFVAAVRREKRKRVDGQHVHELPVLPHVDHGGAVRGKRVHAGDDGARRVLQPDGRGDGVHPHPELALGRLPETVALVAEIPRRDGRMVAELAHHPPHEPDLPLDRLRVRDDIAAFERRRHEEAPAHPARHQADDELESMPPGRIAHPPEPRKHFGVDAVAPDFQPVLPAPTPKRPGPAQQTSQRLEVRPQREDPQRREPVLLEGGELVLDAFRAPVAPHQHADVLRPVVAADEEPAVPEKR